MADCIDGLMDNHLDSNDLDFVCGGAKVSDNINPNLLKVAPEQRCNCSQFVRGDSCGNLDICDNCSFALTPYLGSMDVYCSKQTVVK